MQEKRYDLITNSGIKIEVKKCKTNNPIFKYKQLSESFLEKGKLNIKLMILKTNSEQTHVIDVKLYDEYLLSKLILKDEYIAKDIIRLYEMIGGVYQNAKSFKFLSPALLWEYSGINEM